MRLAQPHLHDTYLLPSSALSGHSSALSSHYELLPNDIVRFIVVFFAIIVPFPLEPPLSLSLSSSSCRHRRRRSRHHSLRAHATPLLVAVASAETGRGGVSGVRDVRGATSPFSDRRRPGSIVKISPESSCRDGAHISWDVPPLRLCLLAAFYKAKKAL